MTIQKRYQVSLENKLDQLWYQDFCTIDRSVLCPKCRSGTCIVEHAKVDIELADEKILLSEFDMQFINSLKVDSPQYPSGLAQELDCTYQKVGKRAAKLKDMGFLKAKKMTRDKSLGERNYYSLTDDARDTYFKNGN
jgi:DNA-binding MarR family transcriptional regulator